jgi:hypothetical protein
MRRTRKASFRKVVWFVGEKSKDVVDEEIR